MMASMGCDAWLLVLVSGGVSVALVRVGLSLAPGSHTRCEGERSAVEKGSASRKREVKQPCQGLDESGVLGPDVSASRTPRTSHGPSTGCLSQGMPG